MFNLHDYMEIKSRQINHALEAALPQTGPSKRVLEAMRYSLMAGGKRLRPILCLAAADAVGGDGSQTLPAACALEMIHTYSLIHDDLPAMDDDELRRGRPTCHMAFDEATAILAGDGLLTSAFEILSTSIANSRKPQAMISCMKEIAQAAGCTGMIAGQMQDMDAEGRQLTTEQLKTMHLLKTGAMIRASVRCGARLGGASEQEMQALTIYAGHLGLAFQVTDDILNVEGDPAKMGKAAGTDSARSKNAYPALLGLKKSKLLAQQLIDNALKEIKILKHNCEPLTAIAQYVVTRNK